MGNIIHIDKNVNIVVKLSPLFVGAIIVYSRFIVFNNNFVQSPKDILKLAFTWILVSTIILIPTVYFLLYKKLDSRIYGRYVNLIIIGMYILFFTLVILVTGTYLSNYKYVFLLAIIISAIELGLKSGVLAAVISSIIVLSIDLIFFKSSGVNIYFENDLILCGVFNLIAFTLGTYVKDKSRNLNEKDLQLQSLNNELYSQIKQSEYIEEMILKNEDCCKLLIENYHDAILIHHDNKIIFANEIAQSFFNIKDFSDIEEKDIFQVINFSNIEEIKEHFEKIYINKTNKVVFEGQIIRDESEMINIENTSLYFSYRGKPTILSIIHDISSQKKVEKLQIDMKKNIELLKETKEYNKLITEFFSNISHELKTPLNVIFSAIQTLEIYKTKETKEFMEIHNRYQKIMKQNSYRLLRLINNILDITRIDSGFMKFNAQSCNIVEIIEDITLSVVDFAKSKDITIIFDTDIEEKIMTVDPDKIERIILNLLSNAIKFTDSNGEIYVKISDKKEFIDISIKDTGVGIPKNKLAVIFERFGQVDKTLKRNHEGTGIGLSLVKSLVEMHKGNIIVDSKDNIGSEFKISLPFRILPEDKENKILLKEANIERINIEFSDIYT